MRYEKCASEGCERAAQFVPQICVPAMGWPASRDISLKGIVNLKLCHACCVEFKAAEQFEHPTTALLWQNLFRTIAKAQGSEVPPDFARAWTYCLPIDTEEYAGFERAFEKGMRR
jgi:hypothetical protein